MFTVHTFLDEIIKVVVLVVVTGDPLINYLKRVKKNSERGVQYVYRVSIQETCGGGGGGVLEFF